MDRTRPACPEVVETMERMRPACLEVVGAHPKWQMSSTAIDLLRNS